MPDDQVRDACTRLAGYLATLERVLPDPSAGGMPGIPVPRPVQPLPGDQAAWFALTSALEGIRRLEALLRYLGPAGHPGPRRSMSATATAGALAALPKLAAGPGEDLETAAGWYLERLIRGCQSVPAIDEITRYRSLPKGGGGLPPACPCCGCLSLKAVLGPDGRLTGRVECHAYRCRDGAGYQPSAQMGTDEHGRACLAWADGKIQIAPELEPALGAARMSGIQCECGRFLARPRAISDMSGEGYGFHIFLSDVRGDCSRCGSNSQAAREGWWWSWDAWNWPHSAELS
jgi:hypothetical protein